MATLEDFFNLHYLLLIPCKTLLDVLHTLVCITHPWFVLQTKFFLCSSIKDLCYKVSGIAVSAKRNAKK